MVDIVQRCHDNAANSEDCNFDGSAGCGLGDGASSCHLHSDQ